MLVIPVATLEVGLRQYLLQLSSTWYRKDYVSQIGIRGQCRFGGWECQNGIVALIEFEGLGVARTHLLRHVARCREQRQTRIAEEGGLGLSQSRVCNCNLKVTRPL